MRAALPLTLCALLLAGCLREEARITSAPPAGCAPTAGSAAVLAKLNSGAADDARHGPLPFDVPALWYLRSPDGDLLIGRARAESPLPWWQRFPFDLAVELWPGDVVITATATVTPQPVRTRSADEITAEARAHGYAR